MILLFNFGQQVTLLILLFCSFTFFKEFPLFECFGVPTILFVECWIRCPHLMILLFHSPQRICVIWVLYQNNIIHRVLAQTIYSSSAGSAVRRCSHFVILFFTFFFFWRVLYRYNVVHTLWFCYSLQRVSLFECWRAHIMTLLKFVISYSILVILSTTSVGRFSSSGNNSLLALMCRKPSTHGFWFLHGRDLRRWGRHEVGSEIASMRAPWCWKWDCVDECDRKWKRDRIDEREKKCKGISTTESPNEIVSKSAIWSPSEIASTSATRSWKWDCFDEWDKKLEVRMRRWACHKVEVRLPRWVRQEVGSEIAPRVSGSASTWVRQRTPDDLRSCEY